MQRKLIKIRSNYPDIEIYKGAYAQFKDVVNDYVQIFQHEGSDEEKI